MEKIINTYIKYLSKILPTNYEFESWIPKNKCVEESQPLEHKLKNININLINCETQGYKTPYEVLNELSEVWNNY